MRTRGAAAREAGTSESDQSAPGHGLSVLLDACKTVDAQVDDDDDEPKKRGKGKGKRAADDALSDGDSPRPKSAAATSPAPKKQRQPHSLPATPAQPVYAAANGVAPNLSSLAPAGGHAFQIPVPGLNGFAAPPASAYAPMAQLAGYPQGSMVPFMYMPDLSAFGGVPANYFEYAQQAAAAQQRAMAGQQPQQQQVPVPGAVPVSVPQSQTAAVTPMPAPIDPATFLFDQAAYSAPPSMPATTSTAPAQPSASAYYPMAHYAYAFPPAFMPAVDPALGGAGPAAGAVPSATPMPVVPFAPATAVPTPRGSAAAKGKDRAGKTQTAGPEDEERRHPCSVKGCPLMFIRLEHAKRHSEICGKSLHVTKNVPCPECGTLFTREDNMKIHARTKHQMTFPPKRERKLSEYS